MASIYLDWNATTPPLEEVIAAMNAAARDAWGNPSSVHAAGRAARARVEDAREAVAKLVGADVRDVVLTSGGTEANNLALRSAFVGTDGVLATSRLEHPSVTRVAEALEREGRARVRWLAVREDGRVDVEDVERALAEGGVRLVAVGAVNQETGVVQEIEAVARLAHAKGARLHVDAAQALGKIEPRYDDCDTVAIAAHKMRAPKGIGALVVRRGARIEPVLLGGSQERGLRPGTTDPVAAAGLAVAARHATTSAPRYAGIATLRDELERALVAMHAGASVNGTAPRAPHVTNVAFPRWSGPELVAALDLEGVCVSSGSACSAGTTEPSPVLVAMFGTGDARAESSVRVSMGEGTTEGDVEGAVGAFGRVLARR